MPRVATEAVKRDIVVVGASAGGVESLRTLVAELPGNLPAAVVVVLHVAATGRSVLPSILSRAGEMAASHPDDGERIEHGKIYVAPPDRHIVVHESTIGVQGGPKENGHRPAIDPLFRSAASHYGPRVVGVILSGTLDDGASGLRSIKEAGGLALVQDPDEAMYESMPRAAIAYSHPHAVVPAAVIGRMIGEVAGTPIAHEERQAAEAEEHAGNLRELLESIGVTAAPDPAGEHAERVEKARRAG